MSDHPESCPCCEITAEIVELVHAKHPRGGGVMHLVISGILEAAALVAANCVREGKQEETRDWLINVLNEHFDDAVIRVAEEQKKGAVVQ